MSTTRKLYMGIPIALDILSITAIAVLVGFFPANIYAALNQTGMGGHLWGPVYLLIRGPLQALLIWWTWYYAVRSANPGARSPIPPAGTCS